MSDNNYQRLGLHKSDCIDLDNPLDWSRSTRLREQLVEEIQALEEQLASLQDCEGEVDFSQQQTCREMIHSRQQLFLQLRR
ncbi:MAG: hypothetical protein ABJ308_05685 [Halieaceae bacterium]